MVFTVLLALGALIAGLGWFNRGAWATGMLVLAPSPDGEREAPPEGVRETLEIMRPGARIRSWVFEPAPGVAGGPRGTLLMLHGIRDRKRNQIGRARAHAARGHRVIAVDSRGHGESSGKYLTYGVEEARDLRAVVDELQRRGQLVPPLGVVGSSYGGATALQLAALDPRVERVVAMASFASLREVVPAYLEWFFGPPGRWIPRAMVDELIDGATARAGFDADAACPRCVASKIRAAVLLIHSRDDERIPWQHSELIAAALQTRHELMLVDGAGHVFVGEAPGVAAATERWLDAPRDPAREDASRR
jgi:pimeloyl-ACP methyl ester carboxylesterase